MNKYYYTVSGNTHYIPGLNVLQLLRACGIADNNLMVIEAKRMMRKHFHKKPAIDEIFVRNDDGELLTKEWLPSYITSEEEAELWFHDKRYKPRNPLDFNPQVVTTMYRIFQVCGRYVVYHTQSLSW